MGSRVRLLFPSTTATTFCSLLKTFLQKTKYGSIAGIYCITMTTLLNRFQTINFAPKSTTIFNQPYEREKKKDEGADC